jgi:hypothetical protein
MYINSIEVENLRTFKKSKITFVHPDRDYGASEFPKPKLPNVNLLLGDNGSGKSTLLMAIALAALGPAVDRSGIFAHSFVRRDPKRKKTRGRRKSCHGTIEAKFTLHDQDIKSSKQKSSTASSKVIVERRGELEGFEAEAKPEDLWEPIFSSQTDSFFFVGYGATRRVEPGESLDMGARSKSKFARAQRIQGLFEDSYSLIPLTYWLPKLRSHNRGRYVQVEHLINDLMGAGHYQFEGELEEGNYLFERGHLKVPFLALSDGYRAFLGWVTDLLYHVCYGCPSGAKLVDNHGIVMVDEIDLHLHPKWQMKVISTIARALPNIQFIITSHSPLVTGSLEWMNIISMKTTRAMTTSAKRIQESVRGLDADQVLLSDYFGLSTSRAPDKQRRITNLTERARLGSKEAAKQLLKEMTKGIEEVQSK